MFIKIRKSNLMFYAKIFSNNLFHNMYCSQLFGEEDPDEDVSPDTADPEATGNTNYLEFYILILFYLYFFLLYHYLNQRQLHKYLDNCRYSR